MYRFLTSLGPKNKNKKRNMCAEQASLRLLRVRHSGASLASSRRHHKVKCTWRLLVVSCADTQGHTHAHTRRRKVIFQKESYWTTHWWWWRFCSLRVCAMLNQSLPALGRGMTRPKDLYFCRCHEEASHTQVPKYMTREEVWLLICAVTTTNLGELPSGWTLSCQTAS